MQEALALLGLKWDRLHSEVMDRCPLTAAELKQWGSQAGSNFTPGHWQMERELVRITNLIVLEKILLWLLSSSESYGLVESFFFCLRGT